VWQMTESHVRRLLALLPLTSDLWYRHAASTAAVEHILHLLSIGVSADIRTRVDRKAVGRAGLMTPTAISPG
jgi:hypothetical protein